MTEMTTKNGNKVTIKRCPSGFYAVFVDDVLFYGASATFEDAIRYIHETKLLRRN